MRTAAALLISAAALLPATAWAGWHENSYKTTFDRMEDIRNTLMRWCGTKPEIADYAAYVSGEGCAAHFNQSTIGGVPFGFERKTNPASLTTTARWAFAFNYPDATYFVSLLDVTAHQSADRDRTTDRTSSFLEVVRYPADGTPPERLTGIGAWRGRVAGKERKDQYDTPSMADYKAGIERVIRDVRKLRFTVREAYNVN